jgi:TetR/AcrR family transcriptional regulator, transcriptional repressor of bet genes
MAICATLQRDMSYTRQNPDVRRAALLDAAVACLVNQGPTRVTTRSIAAEAGVSSGLLSHYFEDKEDLLKAAYRHLRELLSEAEDQALASAGDDPGNRLRAFLLTGFREPFLGAIHLRARVVFWSLAVSDPEFAAVHNEIYADWELRLSNLIHPFIPGITPADRTVAALSAMLDGLWLEHATGRTNVRDPADVIEAGIALVQTAAAFARP